MPSSKFANPVARRPRLLKSLTNSIMAPKLRIASVLGCSFLLSNCTSFPTLVEVARVRSNQSPAAASNLYLQYTVTDMDVLNFTNGVKRHLDKRSSIHTNVRYGSATTLATLGGLAGAAKTVGWSTGTASALGLGATYVFGLGQIFNSKGHAQAYEQSLAEVQAAEAAYFFYRLGGRFKGGKVDQKPQPTSGVPSSTELTYEGEALYYRVTKILNVLYDSLSGKIPDLQDLKEARGEGAGATGSPPSGDGGGGGGGSGGGGNQGLATPISIPEHLKPRNERLETAFKNMNEADVTVKLNMDGEFVPQGSTLKQHVATLILSDADLPHPAGKDALESLTFYRERAVDEAATAKLEEAYRKYHVLLPP